MDAPDMIDDRDAGTTSGVEWRVAHTLARCEKKVWDWLRQQGWRAELPLYRSVKRYRGKKVEFHKPLFPGYVFVQVPVNEGRKVEQHDQVARLLVPPDQAEFDAQLGAILAAIEAGLELVPVTTLKPGMKVEIVSGPLRGLHGVVEQAKGVERLARYGGRLFGARECKRGDERRTVRLRPTGGQRRRGDRVQDGRQVEGIPQRAAPRAPAEVTEATQARLGGRPRIRRLRGGRARDLRGAAPFVQR